MSNQRQDYLKPAPQVICDLINKANPGRSFTPNDLEFGTPRVHQISGGDTQARNTDLEVTVLSTETTTTVNYGRLDLGARQGLANGDARIPFTGQVTVGDCLSQINDLAGLALTTDDVLNVALDDLSEESLPYNFILTARDSSLIVIGSVPVVIYGEDDEGNGEDPEPDPQPEPEPQPEPDPEPEPPPPPEPGVMQLVGAFADRMVAQAGDMVMFSINLGVVGEAPTQDAHRIDILLDGLAFSAPMSVPIDQGITMVSSPGSNEVTVAIAPGAAVGTHFVNFTAIVDADAVGDVGANLSHDIGGAGQTMRIGIDIVSDETADE